MGNMKKKEQVKHRNMVAVAAYTMNGAGPQDGRSRNSRNRTNVNRSAIRRSMQGE